MNSAFYRSPGIYNPAFEVTDLDYDYLVATPHGDDGYYDPIGPSAHPGGRGGRFSSPPSRNHQPSGLGDYPGIVEPTYFPSPTGPYRGSAYDAPIDPMAYTEYACPPGDVVNPYKGHRYEPPGPKTHTDALARAGNMTTRNRDYDFEREVERQRAEEMERAGAVIQGPMADVEEHVQRRKASPGDLDEMRARVEAEDAGFYREPVDGAAWAFPQEPYSDREPDDGRPWAFPQPPCSDVESITSADFYDVKDMKEEAPYRDADGDYKDIEKKGPFEIGFAQGGMPRRKSWADTALTAARFMAMFATAMLVAFMVYSQHRYTRGLPLITNSSSMEMVASSDDSCGL